MTNDTAARLLDVVLAELARGTHTESFADGARWAVQELDKILTEDQARREEWRSQFFEAENESGKRAHRVVSTAETVEVA